MKVKISATIFMMFILIVSMISLVSAEFTQLDYNDIVEDSYVWEYSKDANYYSSELLTFYERSTRYSRSYISFDISSVSDSNIAEDAQLCLYEYTTGNVVGDVGVYHVYYDAYVSESSITWNNQPCGTTFSASANCNLTASDTTDIISGEINEWRCWNVTDIINAEHVPGNDRVSFVLKRPSESHLGFGRATVASSEYATAALRPYLNITHVSASSYSPPDQSSNIGSSATNLSSAYNGTVNLTYSDLADDASVWEYSPDTNYGARDFMRLYERGSRRSRAYLTFNFPPSLTSSITANEAQLCAYEHRISNVVSSVNAYHVYGAAFVSEENITWNNQPCGTSFDNSFNCNLTNLDSVDMVSRSMNRVHCWDVTEALNLELALANSRITLALKRATETQIGYGFAELASKEYRDISKAPYLQVSFLFNASDESQLAFIPEYTYDFNVSKVKFRVPVNLSGLTDLDDCFVMEEDFIFVNTSSECNAFANPAYLTFSGINNFDINKVIYGSNSNKNQLKSEGKSCILENKCFNPSCSGTNCTIDVTSFSGYAYEGNANLTINNTDEENYVSADSDFVYYAYYINATGGAHIASASCNITDSNNTYVMNEQSGEYYYYNKSGGFSNQGQYDWNVTCDKTGFTTLFANDTLDVGYFTIEACPGSGLTKNGEYHLSQNLVWSTNGSSCFNILISNVDINCDNYNITHSGNGLSRAMTASNINNLTVRGCNFYNETSSEASTIYLDSVNNSLIYNNSIENNDYGFYIDYGNNVEINDNSFTIDYDSGSAIYLYEGINHLVFNNIVNTISGPGIKAVQGGSYINITNNIITTSSNVGDGIWIGLPANESYFYIAHNSINTSGSAAAGIGLAGGSLSNIFNNSIITLSALGAYGILLDENTSSNVIRNNNISSADYTLMDASSFNNTLIYNNSYGEINWTGMNLTTDINLSIDNTVFVQQNLLGLIDDSDALELNGSARITFWGLDLSIEPDLLKNELDYCFSPDCEIVDWGSSYAIFDVSSFSNYSIDGQLGGQGEDPPAQVPEFSDYAIMLLLALTVGGFVVIRRKEN
ncbi:DNRLRE domain-containing protein [Candidatus Woesearchaeota archaeon]|jgi:hypothetical protein|nr:DNRLRE domain-containing protein [Candidatus Woesearchaeota archaeon]